MADTYGVTPADIAAELPGIFPGGFTVSTKPTLAQVTSMITAADLMVTVAVQNASGSLPNTADRLAPLAKRVIIEQVKGQVVRVVYAGNAPADVASAAAPYETLAKTMLTSITDLQTQAVGVGDPPNRVVSSSIVPTRELLVADTDLGRRGYERGQY